MVISAEGTTVKNCLAEARRIAGLDLKSSREISREEVEGGLYRVVLDGGHVVECTVIHGAVSSANVI